MIGEYAQPQNDHLGFVNASYVSPYDDLAFEMYVDREVAKIIRKMELKKLKAVEGNSKTKLDNFFMNINLRKKTSLEMTHLSQKKDSSTRQS